MKGMMKNRGVDGVMQLMEQQVALYDRKGGAKFKNAEAEVDDIIKKIPELKPARSRMVALYGKCREKTGLPV